MSKFLRYKNKILAGLMVFSLIYLTVHFLIFDKDFKYEGLKTFLLEGGEHVWHVLPVVVLFLIFFVKSHWDSYQEKKKTKLPAPAEPSQGQDLA